MLRFYYWQMKMMEKILEKYERVRDNDEGDEMNRKWITLNYENSKRDSTHTDVERACALGQTLEEVSSKCRRYWANPVEKYQSMSLEEFDLHLFTILDTYSVLPYESKQLLKESSGFSNPLQGIDRYRKRLAISERKNGHN